MNTTTPPSSVCPQCGSPLGDSTLSLCPRCLMQKAFQDTGEKRSSRPLPPPNLSQVQAAFPGLQIIELIGAGGMGAVYKARQPKLDRFVALKLLPEALALESAFRERFNQEGRVLARLNHPHVVTVHDFGESNHFFYLLMEYVDGVSLRQAMQSGRFTPAQALAIVPPICEALQYAHDQGILHRDVKPENILLDSRGRVKLADFGIAKIMGKGLPDTVNPSTHLTVSPNLTQSDVALSTPAYMAPEQKFTPEKVDPRADIYSLGVVLYELLTGELPKPGQITPPSKSVGTPGIDQVVLRALQRDPDKRPQNVTEFRTSVERLTTESLKANEAAQSTPSATPPEPSEAPAIPVVQAAVPLANPVSGQFQPEAGPATAQPGQGPNWAPYGAPRKAQVYFSTPDHLETNYGKFVDTYLGSGELSLDGGELTLSQPAGIQKIPLRSINAVELGYYPWTAKPQGILFLKVSYVEQGKEVQLLVTPLHTFWQSPSSTNLQVVAWYKDICTRLSVETKPVPPWASIPNFGGMGIILVGGIGFVALLVLVKGAALKPVVSVLVIGALAALLYTWIFQKKPMANLGKAPPKSGPVPTPPMSSASGSFNPPPATSPPNFGMAKNPEPKGGPVSGTLLILGVLGLLFGLVMLQTHSFGPMIALVFMILTWMVVFPAGRKWLGTWLFWLTSVGGVGLLCLESNSVGPIIGLAVMTIFWMIFFKSGRKWLATPWFWALAFVGTGLICIEVNSLGPVIGILFVLLIYLLSTGKNPLDTSSPKPLT